MTITKHNYFPNKNNIIIQNDGLAMGAPSFGILSGICLQYIEAIHTAHRTETQDHKIFSLCRRYPFHL
jgi:hypothetical protein